DADTRIGGQQTHDAGGRRHHDDREGQRGLASFAVAVDADDDGAHRTHDETDAERRKAAQQRNQRVGGGEKIGSKRYGEKAVDCEVEQFQEISDRGGNDRPSSFSGTPACACDVRYVVALCWFSSHHLSPPVQDTLLPFRARSAIELVLRGPEIRIPCLDSEWRACWYAASAPQNDFQLFHEKIGLPRRVGFRAWIIPEFCCSV